MGDGWRKFVACDWQQMRQAVSCKLRVCGAVDIRRQESETGGCDGGGYQPVVAAAAGNIPSTYRAEQGGAGRGVF
jgi:hypothetical protein